MTWFDTGGNTPPFEPVPQGLPGSDDTGHRACDTAGRRYRTIVADPPWPVRQPPKSFKTGTQNAPLPYETMSVDAIQSLPIAALAQPSAHLYLWTVNRHVRSAYDIAGAWGFTPSMLLTWCKEPMGIGAGRQFASTTEFVLFAWRGAQEREPMRIERNWWVWPRGEHSAKPEAFLDLVEQVSPGPYLELFARRQRLGWDTWGNEALEHVSLTPEDKPVVRGGGAA